MLRAPKREDGGQVFLEGEMPRYWPPPLFSGILVPRNAIERSAATAVCGYIKPHTKPPTQNECG